MGIFNVSLDVKARQDLKARQEIQAGRVASFPEAKWESLSWKSEGLSVKRYAQVQSDE